MTNVIIFEDNTHLRETLQMLPNEAEGYRCTAAYPNCTNLIKKINSADCDVVLMDIEMPGINGIEATKMLKAEFPDIPILIQTAFSDDNHIFDAICAGASGYILKTTTPAGYIEAIAEVQSGGSPITPGIAKRVLALFRDNMQPSIASNEQYNWAPRRRSRKARKHQPFKTSGSAHSALGPLSTAPSSRQSAQPFGDVVLQVWLDLAGELDGQRVALEVERLPDGDADPALADEVLLDVPLLLPVELDADPALQQRLVVMRATRVVAQAVGECIAHAARIGRTGRQGKRLHRFLGPGQGNRKWRHRWSAVPREEGHGPQSARSIGPVQPRVPLHHPSDGPPPRAGEDFGECHEAGRPQSLRQVSPARARLGQSRARLAAAELALKRQQQLASEGIGAQRTLIEAEAQVGELKADVEGVRRQLAVFGSGSAGELQLVSPITGVIVELHATLGETAGADEAVFTITDPTKVWVRGNVPELEIDRVKLNTAAIVRTHAYPDMVLAGTVNYVAPSLDEKTRSLPIRVTLEAPDPRLRSGLYGSIELVGGDRDERVLVVPIDAVATVDGQ